VARRRLDDPGGTDGNLHRPLEHGFVDVVAAPLAGHGLYVETRGGEDPLQTPFAAGVRVLAQERAGQFDPTGAVAGVGLVLLASAFQVGGQGGLDRGRQHRHPVLVALETVLIPATPSCSWAPKIVDRRGAYKRNPATIVPLRFAARSSPTA
jgi:hypothetical protein